MVTTVAAAEDWLQFKYDCRHSGNVPDRSVTTPLGLVGTVPLTDAVFTAPVVADGRVYVVDGAGVAFCIDAATLRVLWKFESRGGEANCNNVSSPAIAGRYLHFGTMAGSYYVLDAASGTVVKEIACGEPVFSTPVVANDRAYFATLGSKVYAVEADGTVCWTWDFVKERLSFTGNRWSGEDWLKHKGGERVTWRDQFCCPRNVAVYEKTVVVPAGGETIWLQDAGSTAKLRGVGLVPEFKGSETPATFGQSIDETGAVYRQFHRRDNSGRVEILRLRGGKVEAEGYVPGTLVRNDLPGLLSFCSVSLRGKDVYRCRPEEGFGFCKHSPDQEQPQYLGGYPSIASPVLLRDTGVYGGLDGSLYVVALSGSGRVWSFKTGFGMAISAPVAVCDGRIYFGCEDGYLYVLGTGGKAQLPSRDLQLWKIRSPLTGKLADSKYDWFTNFGDLASSNANNQGIKPPFKIKWIRRYAGTFKHIPVCGGGRMYTHTAEGQVFAVEQETGRLLWRRYWPGVHISFTSPIYYKGRLLVPQAGMKKSRMRCLDAATGEMLWEAAFTGSPSWSRQQPPIIYKRDPARRGPNLAIYMFGTGKYAPKGTGLYVMRQGQAKEIPDDTEGVMSWLYSHDNPYYPPEHRPVVRAWDIDTGREVWTKDFSGFGAGGDDAGLCLMNDTLYYSCFFGYSARTRRGLRGPKGITAAIDPETGDILWLTTTYSVTGGCTISGEDGRLYLGGYNPPNEKTNDRHVWCLDARDGSLIWQSEPLSGAVNGVGIGERFIFAHARAKNSYQLDKNTGNILSNFSKDYYCTRFTFSEPYIMGANMDMIDSANGNKLASSGPCVDVRECVGGIVSNGRIFYTSQSSGLQVSQVCGTEAASLAAPWLR
jgi:outer membrane protein assembly factor BamB